MTITFVAASEYPIPLFADTDPCIEQARLTAEVLLGHQLPVDPRTGFPEFVLHDDSGEVVGGG